MPGMTDYDRIAQVLRYLDRHHEQQPGLAELADVVSLSPHHFHRLFVRWAGVTPKKFLQLLTTESAVLRLKQGESVLQASLNEGLSGPGRLHDLTVSLRSASPGEIKSGGAGWTIEFGFASTPFGRCVVAESPRGICWLSFIDPEVSSPVDFATDYFHGEWPRATLERNDEVAANWVAQIFQPQPVSKNAQAQQLSCYVRGTTFQVKVWQALLNVPEGHLCSYGQLATAIGQPGSSRAVGSAVAANSLAVLIPCHRVIRATGAFGHYRWGTERKQALLAAESISRDHRPEAKR